MKLTVIQQNLQEVTVFQKPLVKLHLVVFVFLCGFHEQNITW